MADDEEPPQDINEDFVPVDNVFKVAEEEEEESEPPPPPPKQKLYLLEFVVDDVSLDFCNEKQLICFGVGKTVIEIHFLDIGPLRISEDDFTPVQKRYLEGCRGTGSIKNGKSILFGLTPEQADDVASRAIVYCDFIKKTEKREYKLGSCIIRLINMFKELRQLVDEGGKTYYHKNIKDFYKIKDGSGEMIGHVYVYIRMSCFNEMIVNKVKKDPSAEMDFKPDEGFYTYKYNKPKDAKEEAKNICDCLENRGKGIECECPNECPHKTCPQVYTDNRCIYDCPPSLRPCQVCPPSCAANKAAKKIRTNQNGMETKSKASGKGRKSAKGGKGKAKKGKK